MMSDKAPFVVTVILGVLGWLVSHMVDRIVATPTLEYSVEEIDDGGRRGLSVELANVTRNKSFAGLEARIVIPGAQSYGAPILRATQPAFEGTTPPATKGATTTFTLPTMMPGAQASFGIDAVSTHEPILRISSTDATPIRIQRRGLETIFARNEIAILLALFLLWLLALAALAIRAWRRPSATSRAAAAAEPRHLVEIRILGAPEPVRLAPPEVTRPGDSPPPAADNQGERR